MLIYKNKVFTYIKNWIESQANYAKKDTILSVITGGVDSCITAACCSLLDKKCIFLFTGYKLEEEKEFKKWLENNSKKNYEIVDLKYPELNVEKNIDTKSSMILAYIDLYAKKYNALTVGNITKSEYELVKFFKNRVDTLYDCYPIIDLYRSEIIQLGEFLKIQNSILSSKSITEESFGYSYSELEWLSREDYNLGIVSSIKDPSEARHWALYNLRNKSLLNEVYKINKMKQCYIIDNFKMCEIRKSMPGIIQ